MMLEPVTTEQWLELHKRSLDCVRGAIRGLSEEQLFWEDPLTKGQTGEKGCGEPRPFCIAAVLEHICGCEAYWLEEVKIKPDFIVPRGDKRSVAAFQACLDQIEKQYHTVLAERPDGDVLFGLARCCQHALFHLVQVYHLRLLQDPEWHAPKEASWETAVDTISELLINGGYIDLTK